MFVSLRERNFPQGFLLYNFKQMGREREIGEIEERERKKFVSIASIGRLKDARDLVNTMFSDNQKEEIKDYLEEKRRLCQQKYYHWDQAPVSDEDQAEVACPEGKALHDIQKESEERVRATFLSD